MSVRVTGLVSTMLAAVTTSAHAARARYMCSGGTKLTANFSDPATTPGNVVLSIVGTPRAIRLPRLVSADGGRYADGDTEFWIKGRGATLTLRSRSKTCRAR